MPTYACALRYHQLAIYFNKKIEINNNASILFANHTINCNTLRLLDIIVVGYTTLFREKSMRTYFHSRTQVFITNHPLHLLGSGTHLPKNESSHCEQSQVNPWETLEGDRLASRCLGLPLKPAPLEVMNITRIPLAISCCAKNKKLA